MSSKTPFVRQVSWIMVVPQIVAMVASVCIVHIVLRPDVFSVSLILGCGVYLAYSIGSRQFIASAHRTGIRLSRRGKFQAAIPQYERSYQFFTRHEWIDRFRSLVLMSPSATSYREMALVNIAFCHAQLGNAELAKLYYQKTLEKFPGSLMATTSLKMIDTFQKEKPEPEDGEGVPESAPSASSEGPSS